MRLVTQRRRRQQEEAQYSLTSRCSRQQNTSATRCLLMQLQRPVSSPDRVRRGPLQVHVLHQPGHGQILAASTYAGWKGIAHHTSTPGPACPKLAAATAHAHVAAAAALCSARSLTPPIISSTTCPGPYRPAGGRRLIRRTRTRISKTKGMDGFDSQFQTARRLHCLD